jgi:hypothetical protein
MLTLEEIQKIWKKEKKKLKPPNYEQIVEKYLKAIAHTRGINMKVLLKRYRPSEKSEQLERRAELLEPVSKDAFDRTCKSIIQTLSPSIARIEAESEVSDYMREIHFWSFMQEMAIPNMLDDPNGFIVGMMKANSQEQTELPDVDFWIVNYEQVFSFSNKHILFSKTFANSDKEYYYYVSNNLSVRLVENDSGELVIDSDKEGNTLYFVQYDLPNAPAIQLGGEITRSEKNIKYYDSYFASAFAHATKAIQIFSDREAMRMTANPVVVMGRQPCDDDYCGGSGTYHDHPDYDDGETCHTCNGSGFKQGYVLGINDLLFYDKNGLAGDFKPEEVIKFIEPPTEHVKLQNEFANQEFKRTEQALNLIFVDQAQSGVAKEIDREEKEAMINTIAKNVYNRLVLFCFQLVSNVRNNKAKVSISIPEDFRRNSSSNMLKEITELKKEGASVGVIYPLYKRLYTTMYSQEPIAKKIALTMLSIDPLHIYTTVQEKRLASQSSREFEFSKQLPMALSQLAYADAEKFKEMDLQTIRTEVESLMNLPTEQVVIRDNNGE